MEHIDEPIWKELLEFEFEESESQVTLTLSSPSEQEPLWANLLTRQEGERLSLWLSRVPDVPLTLSQDLRLTARGAEPGMIWVDIAGREFEYPKALIHSDILNTLDYLLDALPTWIVPRPRW